MNRAFALFMTKLPDGLNNRPDNFEGWQRNCFSAEQRLAAQLGLPMLHPRLLPRIQ
jgi:hypothetical protein